MKRRQKEKKIITHELFNISVDNDNDKKKGHRGRKRREKNKKNTR